MKHRIHICMAILFSGITIHCLQPPAPKPIPASSEGSAPNCSWCQEIMEPSELLRALPCQHALHMQCYKTWRAKAKDDKSDLMCALCRNPVAIYKLEFTQDDVQQRLCLLTYAHAQIRNFPDGPTKKAFFTISQLLRNQDIDEDSRKQIVNNFLGFLEWNMVSEKLPHLIHLADALDAQVNDLLEQHADYRARLKLAQSADANGALAFLDAEFKRKNEQTKKLEEENKELRAQLSKKKKKSALKNRMICSQSEKLKQAHAGLQTICADYNARMIMYSLVKIGALTYGAHYVAREKFPASPVFNAFVTLSTATLTTLYCAADCANLSRAGRITREFLEDS